MIARITLFFKSPKTFFPKNLLRDILHLNHIPALHACSVEVVSCFQFWCLSCFKGQSDSNEAQCSDRFDIYKQQIRSWEASNFIAWLPGALALPKLTITWGLPAWQCQPDSEPPLFEQPTYPFPTRSVFTTVIGHCARFLRYTGDWSGVDLICCLDDAIFGTGSAPRALTSAQHMLRALEQFCTGWLIHTTKCVKCRGCLVHRILPVSGLTALNRRSGSGRWPASRACSLPLASDSPPASPRGRGFAKRAGPSRPVPSLRASPGASAETAGRGLMSSDSTLQPAGTSTALGQRQLGSR